MSLIVTKPPRKYSKYFDLRLISSTVNDATLNDTSIDQQHRTTTRHFSTKARFKPHASYMSMLMIKFEMPLLKISHQYNQRHLFIIYHSKTDMILILMNTIKLSTPYILYRIKPRLSIYTTYDECSMAFDIIEYSHNRNIDFTNFKTHSHGTWWYFDKGFILNGYRNEPTIFSYSCNYLLMYVELHSIKPLEYKENMIKLTPELIQSYINHNNSNILTTPSQSTSNIFNNVLFNHHSQQAVGLNFLTNKQNVLQSNEQNDQLIKTVIQHLFQIIQSENVNSNNNDDLIYNNFTLLHPYIFSLFPNLKWVERRLKSFYAYRDYINNKNNDCLYTEKRFNKYANLFSIHDYDSDTESNNNTQQNNNNNSVIYDTRTLYNVDNDNDNFIYVTPTMNSNKKILTNHQMEYIKDPLLYFKDLELYRNIVLELKKKITH